MKKDKIVVWGNKSINNIDKFVWKEAVDSGDVIYLPNVFKENIYYYLYRLLFNRKSLSLLPFLREVKRKIDCSFYYERMIYQMPNDVGLIIVSNHSLFKISHSYLRIFKIKHNVGVVLYLYDSYNAISVEVKQAIDDSYKNGLVDIIYSFDPVDCEKYGFSFCKQVYSPIKLPSLSKQPIAYDIYFAGRDKGRLALIYDIIDQGKKQNVESFIRMPELLEEQKNRMKELLQENYVEDMLSYENILTEMQKSNCILEIIQKGQYGISWRAVEALFYNKKLLTNNVDIVHNEFYDSRYIHIFHSVDEINFDWVKEIIDVNYKYNNEYSPSKFIDRLRKDFIKYNNEFS